MSAMPRPEKPLIQTIKLSNIKVDAALQSRAVMHLDDIHEFSNALVAGAVFPPVDVFWDGRDHWLADGFHRHGAHVRAGLKNIRCTVHDGTQADAIVFSAGANQRFSIKRTPADIRKAITMLLQREEWFDLSGAQIARHVGCAAMTVVNVREQFCKETKTKLPQTFRASNGRDQPAIKISRASKRAALDFKSPSSRPLPAERYSLDWTYIRHLFTKRFGFTAVIGDGQSSVYPGIRVAWNLERKILMTACDFAVSDSLPMAVGRLLIAGGLHATRKRLIVLCYPEDGPEATIGLSKDLGIEFVKPEDLIFEIKGCK